MKGKGVAINIKHNKNNLKNSHFFDSVSEPAILILPPKIWKRWLNINRRMGELYYHHTWETETKQTWLLQSQERERKAESVSESQEMPRRKIHWRQNENRHIDTPVSFTVAVKSVGLRSLQAWKVWKEWETHCLSAQWVKIELGLNFGNKGNEQLFLGISSWESWWSYNWTGISWSGLHWLLYFPMHMCDCFPWILKATSTLLHHLYLAASETQFWYHWKFHYIILNFFVPKL